MLIIITEALPWPRDYSATTGFDRHQPEFSAGTPRKMPVTLGDWPVFKKSLSLLTDFVMQQINNKNCQLTYLVTSSLLKTSYYNLHTTMNPVDSLNDPKVPSSGIALFTRKPGILHKLGYIAQGALDRADLFSAVSLCCW